MRKSARVPLPLLIALLTYLERRVGGGRRFDPELSRLIDGLRQILERGSR